MKKKPKILADSWLKCYPSNWKGLIAPDAITHPAKYSSKLIRRIYEHIIAQDWAEEGDGVFDPFGGVGLGALDAMRFGLHWRGVELEPRFVKIGNENIALWNKMFSKMPHWGDAALLEGDSRNLVEILKNQVRTVVMKSPPFGQSSKGGGIAKKGNVAGANSQPDLIGDRSYTPETQGVGDGNLSNMRLTEEGFNEAVTIRVSSPPYADSIKTSERGSGFDYSKSKHKTGYKATPGRESIAHGYGNVEGNLGTLPANDFTLAISSPPFRQSSGGTGVSTGMDAGVMKRHAAGNSGADAYGVSQGQLANLPEGDFEASLLVGSPPFEKGTEGVMRASKFKDPEAFARTQMNKGHKASYEAKMRAMKTDEDRGDYGTTPGNVGNDSGDDFWLAARKIVEQSYLALKPGGHACWVVKDFVKNKQRVPFSDQWRQLCEAVGFVTLHEHHAELVRNLGVSHTLDGGEVAHKKSSKSFFRRVAEKKGSPPIDHETVFCMEKPL